MEDRCQHGQTEIRRREHSNGTTHVVEQCLACGQQVNALTKAKVIRDGILPSRLPAWDEGVRQDHLKQQMERWQAEHERKRSEESAQWWAWYNQYLQSPAWREKRIKVLRRDNFTCLGCGKPQSATQVHHLTYDRAGQEMLFDLVSICETCHKAIHAAKEESR